MLGIVIGWSVALAAEGSGGAVGAAAGLLVGQPGATVEVAGYAGIEGLVIEGRAGLGGRLSVLPTAVAGGQGPLVGLAGAGVGYGAPLTPTLRLGPMAWIDAAVLPAAEIDCGDGCRHAFWTAGPFVGVAVAPAAGVRLDLAGPDGRAFAVGLGVQPTVIYDIFIPIAPRLELGFTRADGWVVGGRAHRYGALLQVGRTL